MKTYIQSCVKGMWNLYPSVNKIKNRWLRWFIKTLISPVILLRTARLFLPGRLEIPSFELVITNRCTLKCRDCAHLVQFYKKPADLEIKSLLEDIDKILNSAAVIYVFKLTGGEAFLHPGLDIIIDRIRKSPVVKKIEIFTNGTIIPVAKVMTAMKAPKITVQISGYGELNKNTARLVEKLKEEKVNYNFSEGLTWCDTGGVEFRGRNEAELKALFFSCEAAQCKSFLNGEFHVCPRSSNGMNLGLIPRMEKEYVKTRGEKTGVIRKKIKGLYGVGYITACNYCDGITPGGKKIPAAVQLEKKP